MLDGIDRRRRTGLLAILAAPIALLAGLALVAPVAKAAEGCSNGALRVQQGATHLPDCRAYEQVSPVEKGFGDADSYVPLFGFPAIPARDRSALYYCPNTKYGDPPSADQGYCASQLSERGENGWRTRSDLVPFACTYDHDGPPAGPSGGVMVGLSSNLERAILVHAEGGSCQSPPLDPNAPQPALNLYSEALTGPGGFTLLTPEHPFTPGYAMQNGDYLGGNEDLSRVIYASSGQQTTDAPPGDFRKLYEWADGELRLVSKNPAEVPFMTGSSLPKRAYHSVSDDGKRIFFQNPADIKDADEPVDANVSLYLREDGERTIEVSQSECSNACGTPAGARFQMATPDGARLWFTSDERLTDDATPPGTKLYMYEHSEDPDTDANLTLITPDNEPADGSDPEVVAVLNGPSDDGKTLYFVAKGQVVAGADTSPGYKIYRWRDGVNPGLDHLATLPGAATPLVDSSAAWNWFPVQFRIQIPGHSYDKIPKPSFSMNRLVTPDGKFLLIQTDKRLDEARDTDTDRDVYRWDEVGGWKCVSCQPPGVESNGRSMIGRWGMESIPSVSLPAIGPHSHQDAGIAMTDDGKVYFESHDRLVPQDQNGKINDVYEWDDGEFNLITNGRGSRDSYLIGTTVKGENVYIISDERLVGWDKDNLNDIYVARVNGGFPEPEPSPSMCDGDGCQGRPTAQPARPFIASAGYEGDGNARTEKGAPKAWLRAAQRGGVRGARVALRVRVSGPGRLVVRGRHLRRTARSVGKPGAYRLPVALNARARKQLRKRSRLRVGARIIFRSSGGQTAARTVKLTFSLPRANHNVRRGGR